MIKIKRLIKSFHYALKGLFKVIKEEQNLHIQLSAGGLVLLLAWFMHISHLEWAILVITIIFVVVVEIINSAVERISDVLKPRIDRYVKEIKDIMAAAVMLASIAAVIVGILIFWPYLNF